MNNDYNNLTISGGTDVFGSDGEKVGSVAGVEGDYVVVSKGFFFPTDYYIPTSAINSADDEGVYLNVTRDQALNQGWDTVPETTTYAESPVVDAGLHVDNPVPAGATVADETEDRPFDHRSDAGQTHVDDTDTIRVPLSEEELTAQTREVERGQVTIDKDVVEREQTLEVPVSEERVNVTRRAVDRDVAAGETAFEEGTIDIPVRGEEVDVQKRARVAEEVEISKDRVQGTQQVTDTVRREEARVRDTTGNAVDDVVDDVRDRTR